MCYYDLHVNFDWEGFKSEGYSKVFVPNILKGNVKYDTSTVNIAVLDAHNLRLPKNYDMVNFKDFNVDISTLSKIRDKQKCVELCFYDVRRMIFDGKLEKLLFFTKVIKSYDIPYVFTSGAVDKFSVKSPKEIAFIGELLGFSQKEVLGSMSDVAASVPAVLER